jgi:hypothetical protein
MKKKYPIKPTEKQLNIMKLYWSMLQTELSLFYGRVGKLERDMSDATKIDTLEFFQVDNDFVGVGNYDRTLKLIQREELEKK